MNKKPLIIKDLPAAIDSLETTAEGQLRGGFAVMGGGADSPMRTNWGCYNEECENNGCTGKYNEVNDRCKNNKCSTDSLNGACDNKECANGPSGNTDNSIPTLGITSLF